MSSSAFTPTQIEVTNEVPVNVPVVEAWNEEALTWNQDPGLSTSGSYTAPRIKWRRVGSNMEGFYDFRNGGSTAANNVQVSFRLPNNLTIDSTKFTALPASIATVGFARKGSAYEYINYYPTGAGTPSKSIYITGGINAQFAADYIGGGWFSVPIAEWAGSGTTTLATRAVEEYAYNTDTTNASNTSAFGYGPDGVNFLSTTPATAAISKRVRFQTPIQPTDSIIFEVNTNGLWRQLSAEAATTAGQQIYNYITHYNNAYGAGRILQVNSTDVDVSFAKYASTGTTYDAASGGSWGSIATGTAKWRVRKVSSGAQVGYPVSARNIVGDTSGSVVPVGMLGEIISGASDAGTLVAGSNTDKTVTTITLPAGNWLIFGQVYFDPGGTTTSRLHSSISTGTSSLTGTILNILGLDVVEGYANLSGGFVNANYNFPVNVLATTTYNINVRVIYTGTPISSSQLRTVIRAIRIA